MAVVNSDFLSGLLTNFRAIFEQDFQAAMAFQSWSDISMRMQSDTETESYNWFGTVPVMEDVTHGSPTLGGLGKYNFSITNNVYKAALEVARTAIEDDKLGLVQPRLRQLGPEAARHPGELIFKLFKTGTTDLAFDGTAFFANTRVIGNSANIDNLAAGTGTTVAQFQADLATIRATMLRFQDDQGRPMNLRPNTLVVPPELTQVAYQALNTNLGNAKQDVPVPSATDGKFQAAGYTVIENPYLTDTNDWYALHIDGAIRPFIFQDRLRPSLEGITSPTSETGVLLDKFIYTVRARYNVGYGDPRYAVKVVNT